MGSEAEALAKRVVALGSELGVRVAVAESLTGGLVLASLVAVPGASHVLNGGIVAYDTDLKRTLLAVDRELLQRKGPVDGAVAEQMATGVRAACAVSAGSDTVLADIGVATTGVAGPDPDPQTGQPAGTVWIGLSSVLGTRSELIDGIVGDRGAVRSGTVRAALAALLREMERLRDAHP